jgi:hypothetical protein
MMDRCAQCSASWTIDPTVGSQDATLESLLDDLISKAVNLGRCYTDPFQLITGSSVAPSLAWHADKLSDAVSIKAAIHSHIQGNYERDD